MTGMPKTPHVFDLLASWLAGSPGRSVECIRVVNGKWIVSLRGAALHTSSTQDTLDSAVRTALMIAINAEK